MPYGSIRKTDHTAADGNAYLRVESSTVFASRFAEAREVIAYAANNTASQIGSIRKTDHTAADGNAYLRVESSTVFASRFAEAREVIAYAANNTASQITPAMSAMR